MLELDLTRIFVKVAQHNSFSKAADALNMPKSTVSKSISRLERETSTKLIVRSTRSLTLTPAGQAFFEASVTAVTQLEDAQKSLYGQDKVLAGLVRITAPEDLGTYVVNPAIAELSVKHPQLKFELSYTDRLVDLVKDGFDVAVRIGKARDSSLILKRAGEVIPVAVASPKYLRTADKIRTPQDLKNHSLLSLNVQGIVDSWTLRSAKSTIRLPVVAKVVSNQMTGVMEMAAAGAGVALVPKYLCQRYLDNGKLVRVLPDWSSPGIPVSIISPLAPSSSARLKVTIDQIHRALDGALRS